MSDQGNERLNGVDLFIGSKTEVCDENVEFSAFDFNHSAQHGAAFIIGILCFLHGIGDGIGLSFEDLVLGDHAVAVGACTVFIDECHSRCKSAFVSDGVSEELCHLYSAAAGELIVDLVETADIGSEGADRFGIFLLSVDNGTVIGTEFKAAASCHVIGHDLEFHVEYLFLL